MEMATAAPISSNSSTWKPEDDVLLKNAIQDGASFEALVKGVVPFSRRFTFQELQDRWHSLLYDSDVASQSSVRMFELEVSGFNPMFKTEQSKSFNFTEVLGKRNGGSVHHHYYSRRKKFRRDFLNPADLNFLEGASFPDNNSHQADFQVLNEESHGGGCFLRNCVQDHYDLLKEADIEILRCAFPGPRDVIVTHGATIPHSSYLNGCVNTVEDKSSSELMRKDGFPADISTSSNKDIRTFELNTKPTGMCSFTNCNSVNFDKDSSVEHRQLSSEENHFRSVNLQPLSAFDSTKENFQNEFLRLQEDPLNSPTGNSFQTIGFPSPQPNLPLWEPTEVFSAASLLDKLKHGDTTMEIDKKLHGDKDCKVKDSPGYNVVHTGTVPEVSHDGPALYPNSSVAQEGEDISDSLLNLSNEDDLLLLNVDKKDTSQKSCSGTLLVSCSSDCPVDGVSKLEAEVMVSESGPVDHCGSTTKRLGAPAPSIYEELQNCHQPAVEVSSSSAPRLDHHGISDGTICCVLNTEDPEIPCNDDIFLLIHPSTSFASPAAPPHPISRDSLNIYSAAKQKQTAQGILMTKGKALARESTWPKKNMLPEAHSAQPVFGFGVKSDVSATRSMASLPLPVHPKQALVDPAQSRSLHANRCISTVRLPNEDLPRVESKAGDNFAAFVEPQAAERDLLNISYSDPTMQPSTSDHSESQSDDDNDDDDDVPCYSDIEAMILEMDLVPYDVDINNTKQVTRYHHEDTNKTIIRLEQCSQSCHRRIMTRQGAFAILYGHRLRYYIRKSEVTLGRSTDDVDVDIDLRKEGCANKISRRQAIIKLEGDGSFSLKNLGRSVISVNGKCIASGQLLGLGSSCLIEMKGMSLLFEINNKCVKRYISALSQKSKGRLSKFDWSQEQNM